MKYWKELFAYFPLTDTDRIENEKIRKDIYTQIARRSQWTAKKIRGEGYTEREKGDLVSTKITEEYRD
jgi:hypothetical protein